MDIAVKDFKNPETNSVEELTIVLWRDGDNQKYICTHAGNETIVSMGDHGRWVGSDGKETLLTIALGEIVKQHSS